MVKYTTCEAQDRVTLIYCTDLFDLYHTDSKMHIPTELEEPTSLSAENCSLPVHSSNNMSESLHSVIKRDVSCNTNTSTSIRST